MPKLTIDGIEIEVTPGTSVLQACEQLGIEIPRFCFHDRLSVPANCRMCLVEMERSPKPIASCAMPCGENMVIRTNTDLVKKARKGVMEFLLINHPLDCPICDQGGECDLQDQAMAYGLDHSRFAENKRAVKEKNLGPLIKTFMTRCIHCTRCVRFADEIAGVPEMGATGRGEHTEIGTYVEAAITSELSGNMIDICPVGALTSKPYQYNARPWELRKTESVDVLDAVGSNIRIDARGGEVMRILPRLHEDVNEEWISDRTRFAYDGLRYRRLDRPFVRKDGKLQEATWDEALGLAAEKLKAVAGAEIAAIAGDSADIESLFALKQIMAGLGSPNLDCRQDGAKLPAGPRGAYIFNSGIAGIEQADAVLIVGANPRREAAMINARLRKRWLAGGVTVGVIGENVDLTYRTSYLGAGAQTLADVADGTSSFAQVLRDAKNPMIIVGMGALTRSDGDRVLGLCRQVAETTGMVRAAEGDDPGWNGFNVLHTAAGRVGALDLGFVPGDGGRDVAGILDGARDGSVKVVWLQAADEIDTTALADAFVIYQGHHGDAGAHAADVVLPGAAYTEKNATYVNTEGRVQLARLAVYPPGDAREDWKILRALSSRVGVELGYDSLEGLRRRLLESHRQFAEIDLQAPGEWGDFGAGQGDVTDAAFASPIEDFYRVDPITRASHTMAHCAADIGGNGQQGMTGTDG